MKHTLLVILSLLFLVVDSGAVQAQTAAAADTATLAPSPPLPPTEVKAFDTPDDHGHSIMVTWKLSGDDEAGTKAVLAYEIQRWIPSYADTIKLWRDSVTNVVDRAAHSKSELQRARRWVKTKGQGGPALVILDSLVFAGESVRVMEFSDTAATAATWRYVPDTLLVYDGIDQVAEATATTDSAGVKTLVGSVVATSEHPIFFDPERPSPTIIRPTQDIKLSVVVGSQTYQADSLILFYGGQPAQVAGTKGPLAELRQKIIDDSVKYYVERIAVLEVEVPKLEAMVKPLAKARDEVISKLPEYYAKYPEGGSFDSVGVVPSGTTSFENQGNKDELSPDYLPNKTALYYRVIALTGNPAASSTWAVAGPAEAKGQWFNQGRWPVFWAVILFGILTIYFVTRARKGAELYVRPLGGIEAVDDAIGRATEMGKPILYVLGLGSAADIATIASFTILSRVAKRVAEYQTQLIVPTYDPIVMTVAQEVVKSAYLDAGRPDAYNDDIVFFVTQAQFAYVAAVNGIMLRQLPATNVYMGKFYAESLILAETGAVAGSIQISGTDEIAQIPFFIVACDYTLIGEELYAASAYLGREPILLGSLKAQDYAKAAFVVLAIAGIVAANFGWTAFTNLFRVTN